MKKKVTLREIGDFYREHVSAKVGWVTLDMAAVRIFDNKGGADNPPSYSLDRHMWTGGSNTLLWTIIVRQKDVSVRDYCKEEFVDYSKCIESVDPIVSPEPTETEGKRKRYSKGVLAYFADGTTVRFDSKCEARNFFKFKRVEQVTQYINTGRTLPDGTTTLDEALD